MSSFFFGPSNRMMALQALAATLADSHLPILLEGEPGTGKESLAVHIHQVRSEPGKFHRVRCDISMQEFRRQIRSNGTGTLFLKHVHLLEAVSQDALLEFVSAPCRGPRLIASTDGSLEKRVAFGQFSRELYAQLGVCRLALPPLRERGPDVLALFRMFLQAKAACLEASRAGDPPLPADLEEAIAKYRWPDNLRELEAVASHYAASPDPEKLIRDLESRSQSLPGGRSAVPHSLRERVRCAAKHVESGIILQTLEEHQWNRRRAARSLKISYRALLYKMKAFQLRGDVWKEAK
jgi:DNA-binding NtrC family response regulator